MLTCILQGALAGVIAHAVHTDTTIDTVVLHTVICVHSTGRPFEAGRTGAPVVRVEEGAGQRMKRNWGKACGHGSESYFTWLEFVLQTRPLPEGEQVRGKQDQPCPHGILWLAFWWRRQIGDSDPSRVQSGWRRL